MKINNKELYVAIERMRTALNKQSKIKSKDLKEQIKTDYEYFLQWHKDHKDMIGFGVRYDKDLKFNVFDVIYKNERHKTKEFVDYYLFKQF